MWSKVLLKADIFADRIGLNINGEERYRTKTGALLSVVYMLILLIIFIQQMTKYFDMTDPITTLQGYATENYPKISLKGEMQLPFFVGSSTEIDYLEIEKLKYYVTLKANRHSWFTTELPDETVNLRRIVTGYPVKPCKELNENELKTYGYIDKESIVWSIFHQYGMCIAIADDLSIEGKGIDGFMEEFYFHVKPCSHPIPEKCATQAEVEKFNFQLFRPTANFNASNFKDPYYRIPNADDIFYLSIKNKQIYTVQLLKTTVNDLIGLNAEWKHTHTYYESGPPLITLQNRNLDKIYCTPESNYVRASDGEKESLSDPFWYFRNYWWYQWNPVHGIYSCLCIHQPEEKGGLYFAASLPADSGGEAPHFQANPQTLPSLLLQETSPTRRLQGRNQVTGHRRGEHVGGRGCPQTQGELRRRQHREGELLPASAHRHVAAGETQGTEPGHRHHAVERGERAQERRVKGEQQAARTEHRGPKGDEKDR